MTVIKTHEGMKSPMWLATAKEQGMNKVQIGIAAGVILVTSACSSISPELDGYHEGWRRATVLEVGPGQTLNAVDPVDDCRTGFGWDASQMRFAVTAYSLGGGSIAKKRRVVAVPEQHVAQVGDQVAINVQDCRLALRAITESTTHH